MNFNEFTAKAEEKLFIIAEAGVNHNGSLDKAFQLVDAAVEAGCDAVKFQTWITERVYSRDKSIKAKYQVRSTNIDENKFEMIKKLELSFKDFQKIRSYCDEKGIIFFSTPDEPESADFLARLGVSLIKTASQDVTNIPFLEYIARLGIPLIFSTGAATLSEVVSAVEAIRESSSKLVILHCVSNYPAPLEQMNLNVIPKLKSMFGCTVGLSDHTTGVEAACAAVALGARVFEKHLTLDKSMIGPDHQASFEPDEMREYCHSLRSVRKALGDGFKRIMPCEEDTRKAFQRFIVASRDMTTGTILQANDFNFKKVVHGISPGYLDLLIGAFLTKDISEDTVLTWDMVKLSEKTLN